MHMFVALYITSFTIASASFQYQQQGFKYLGCFEDGEKRRLRGENRSFLYMSQEMCLLYCKNRSFKYAGLQNGNHCFCGDETPHDNDRKQESDCNSTCVSESGAKCGGLLRNAIYSTGAVPLKHKYIGCYVDEEKGRLKGFFMKNDELTPRICIDRCRELSFKYAGLEDSNECFCGNEGPSTSDKREELECHAECPGDYASTCGDINRMSLYETLIAWNSSLEFRCSDYQYLGCFEDETARRMLRGEYIQFLYMTQEMCMNYCKKKSFRYAGLKNGVDCFCGDESPAEFDERQESYCNSSCPGENSAKCGGVLRNAIFSTGAVPPKHEYVGCYLDEKNRKLNGFFTFMITMTPRSCIDLCRDMSFKYAGFEYGIECFCGNEEPSIFDRRSDSECNVDCSGDTYTSKCGGNWRISVYKTLIARDSSLDFRYSDYQYLGCFVDEANKRRLRGEYRSFPYMTQQMCMNYCKIKSFKHAGLQNGSECYCGDETPSEYDRKSESDCSSVCPAENSKKCGGILRNAIYRTAAVPPKHEYLGCYLDEENRRLKGFFTELNSMTPRSCIGLCRDMFFKYAGLQNGDACFCGNEEPSIFDRINDMECHAECPGDDTSKCGCRWRNSVYKTPITSNSSIEFKCSDYQYLGCFEDQDRRKLRGEYRKFSYMTQQMCMSYCKKRSFKYAGLQNGFECYCGDKTPNEAHRKSESDCNTDCSGENTMKCGGSRTKAIYNTGAVPPKHEYVGCYLDEENRRLKGFFTELNSMTPRSCIDLCRDMSFKYAGLQVGDQCFCGNEEPSFSDRTSDSDCRVECKGDYTNLCGGYWRNSVYETLIARD